MSKRLCNNDPSFDHNQCDDEMTCHSTINEQECTSLANMNAAFDPVSSSFTITQITKDCTNEFTITLFENPNVKEEPNYTDSCDKDLLENVTGHCVSQRPTNTITQEEFVIELEPNAETSAVSKNVLGNDMLDFIEVTTFREVDTMADSDDNADPLVLPINTITKEELIIECEPNVETSAVSFFFVFCSIF